MPATLPTVRSGAVCLYPVNRSAFRPTKVTTFMSGREQRFKIAAPYAGFALEYSKIKLADRISLDNFIASTKGPFDSTWQFTMLGTTYGNLGFETDEFSWEESTPGLYNASLRFRQTISSGAAAAGTGTSYPTFAGGITTQLPFVQNTRYLTARNDLECGIRRAYAFYGAGLTGYPTRGLYGWTLNYSVFTDSEIGTLEGFYALQQGRLGTFSFTDPKDAAVYGKVRFDNDSLEFKYLSPNITSVTVRLVEVP
jgi:hypothetical protein